MQVYPEEKDLASMSAYNLAEYTQSKIYSLLTSMRRNFNLPELQVDAYSEGVVSNVMCSVEATRENIAELVARAKLVCADYDYVDGVVAVPLENTPPEKLNSAIYQNYLGLAEQTFSRNSERIIGNPGITHVGLGIKREGANLKVGMFVSRRLASVDGVLKIQNGLAVIMTGHSADMKICCVNIAPTLQKNAILVGSNKIKHSEATQKYVLMLSSTGYPIISMDTFKVKEIQVFCIQGLQMFYGSGPDITGVPNGAVMVHKQQIDYIYVKKSAVDYSEFNNYSADDLILLLQSRLPQRDLSLSPLPENDSSADMSIPKRVPPKALVSRLTNRTTSRFRTGLSRLPSSLNKPGVQRGNNGFVGSMQKPLSTIEESTAGTSSSFGGFTPMNKSSEIPMDTSHQTPAGNSFGPMGQSPMGQPNNVATPVWRPSTQGTQPTFQFTPIARPSPRDAPMQETQQTCNAPFTSVQMPPGSFQPPRPSILQNAPLFGSQPLYPSFNVPQFSYGAPPPMVQAPGVIPFFAGIESLPRVTLQPIIGAIPPQSEKPLPEFGMKAGDETRRRSIVVKKAQSNLESMNYRAEAEEFMLLNREAKRTREDSIEVFKEHKRRRKELKAKYIQEKQEVNQAFIELYNSTNTFDTICKFKDEKVLCHKIVLIACSPFFKDLINKKELGGSMRREMVTIVMPDWCSASAFKTALKFFYCGAIDSGLPLSKCREVLLLAHHLRAHYLEKLLIVEHIIPHITKEVALDFLRDTHKRCLNAENRSAWRMLENICLNSVANNSSELIKKKQESFVKLDLPLLFKIIERSLFYLVDEDQLPLLLNLAIDAGFATDVCDLLVKLTRNYANCVYFDKQHLNLKYLLRLISPGKDLEVRLMAEDEKSEADDSFFSQVNPAGKLDANSVRAIFEKQRPHNNRVASGIDIRNGKIPTFHFSVNLTKSNIPDTTIFSPAFNSDSRSWHLKLDVTAKGDVSYFLVERGSPVINEANRTKFIAFKDKIPLNFTTVLFEVALQDPVLEKNSMIFFSFSHEQHQIIGHKNFFNVKQLSRKESIELLVWVQEFPFHAAVVQQVSEKFGQLALEEPLASTKTKKLYDLHSSDLYYVLASDHLRCDSEAVPLKCLQTYAALRGSKNIEKIDPLVDAIRFQYVETAQLFSVARDHEVIRNCPSFRKKFIAELKRRSIASSPSIEDPRKWYKAGVKRERPLMEELWDWMLNSQHHSGYDRRIENMKKAMEHYKQAQLKKEALHISQEKELMREVDRLMAAERNLKVETNKRKRNENCNPNRDKRINAERPDESSYCVIL